MVLLTVVPSALKTSIGRKIRSVAVGANPMEIASAARTVRTARTARNTRDGSTGQVFFRSPIVSMMNALAETARLLCGLKLRTYRVLIQPDISCATDKSGLESRVKPFENVTLA